MEAEQVKDQNRIYKQRATEAEKSGLLVGVGRVGAGPCGWDTGGGT